MYIYIYIYMHMRKYVLYGMCEIKNTNNDQRLCLKKKQETFTNSICIIVNISPTTRAIFL